MASERDGVVLAGVEAGYEGRAVLRGVNVRIGAGRVTAVIGPSGAGKSTLAKVMAGVLRPSAGSVTIGDRAVWGGGREWVATRAAYVPQRSVVVEPMTAAEIVALGGYASGCDAAAVRKAMERVDAWGLRDSMYARLSVGQQQRVTLARALVQLEAGAKHGGAAGQVLICDEPVSAQDPKQVVVMMRCVCDVAAAGRAVVVVLHDLNAAARYADEVVVVMSGGVVREAEASDRALEPGRLREVFGVSFQRVSLPVGSGERAGVVVVDA